MVRRRRMMMKRCLLVCRASWRILTLWPYTFADTSIEAPPSVLPQKRYCDITGLEASIVLVKVSAIASDP